MTKPFARTHASRMCLLFAMVCPGASIYVFDIFRGRRYAEAADVIEALEACCYADFDVINMSLSIHETKYKKKLQSLCQHLREAGVWIVASALPQLRSYPALFQSTISVRQCPGERYLFVGAKDRSFDLVGRASSSILAGLVSGLVSRHLSACRTQRCVFKLEAVLGILRRGVLGVSEAVFRIDHLVKEGSK